MRDEAIFAEWAVDAAQKLNGIWRKTEQQRLEMGRILLDVKSRLPFGDFLPWVKEHCNFTPRTAQRYMDMVEAPTFVVTTAKGKEHVKLSGKKRTVRALNDAFWCGDSCTMTVTQEDSGYMTISVNDGVDVSTCQLTPTQQAYLAAAIRRGGVISEPPK